MVLQIGSNDLCNFSRTVNDVAKGIIEFTLQLKFCYNVRKVAVIQILHKLPPTIPVRYPVDTVKFNKRCDELNLFLGNYFKDDKVEGVRFWRHQGFWTEENKRLTYMADGTHLNVEHGYPKYYQNVRRVVVSMLKSDC